MAGDEDYHRELFFHDHNFFENLSGGVDLDVSPLMSFDDYLHASRDVLFGSGELTSDEQLGVADGTTNSSNYLTPSTRGRASLVSPNSSAASSSTEAVGEEEDSGRCRERMKQDEIEQDEKQPEAKPQGDTEADSTHDKSKKLVSKPRKNKGEKRQREARFAFLTKSEVDHLEDGYRWRKYGQKAVKNSPFPRSYYRCTTQKCPVKKMVERSYLDPTTVITTYEGKHTHQSPASSGRGINTRPVVLLPPPPAAPTGSASLFHYHRFGLNMMHQLQVPNHTSFAGSNNMHLSGFQALVQQGAGAAVHQFPDYSILEHSTVPTSFVPKVDPDQARFK